MTYIKVHTQGITGSRMIRKGEEADGLFAGLLEIDGEIYDRVNDIEVKFGEEFATVTATFIPGHVEVVAHNEDSWKKVCGKAENRERQRSVIRNSDGRLIAVYVPPEEDE